MIPSIPEIFFCGKIIDVAEVNQRPWLEESGQGLENGDRTHLVLASGKPVLQKSLIIQSRTSDSLNGVLPICQEKILTLNVKKEAEVVLFLGCNVL